MDTETRQTLSREQYRRLATDLRLRRNLIEADFGRSLVWEVRWNGATVADLIDPYEEEENWYSYAIVPLPPFVDDPGLLKNASFWLHPGVTFEHRGLGLVATHAFAAGDGPRAGRIRICGLHFKFEPTRGEKLRMKWRAFFARFRK